MNNEQISVKVKSKAEIAISIIGAVVTASAALTMSDLARVLAKGFYEYEKRRCVGYSKPRGSRANWRIKKSELEKSRRTLYYLKRRGYIQMTNRDGTKAIMLTEGGVDYLNWIEGRGENVPSKDKWDGYWWLVLADVPSNSHKKQAEILRIRLRSLGFYPLQRTVWVYPFDPSIAINKITSYYGLGHFVTVAKASLLDFEDMKRLKRHFKL